MSVRNLSRMLAPRRVAVIGAGSDPRSVGAVILENLLAGDFDGIVYPVNPHHEALHGVEVHRSVGALPEAPDLAVICTPAATVPGVVRECGEAGVAGVVVVSAGFREIGPEGAALEREVDEAAKPYDGLRIIGPNCLGVLVPPVGLNASFARARLRPGKVALVSQSGALAASVLDWADDEGVGFSAVISAGNMLDVDLGDLIDHLAEDSHTHSLILYLESVTNPRKFMSAARAFARRKPIVAYKAGRFAKSAKAAVSHTGAIAGADDVYDAALRRAGIVRVGEIQELFETAELLNAARVPRGPRLGIVTNAGGPGVMAADALLARRGELPELSEETVAGLDKALPAQWSRGNPVDILGDADQGRYATALEALLADEAVEAVLVILTPQAMTDPDAVAVEVERLAGATRKPVLAAWMGGRSVKAGGTRLEAAGVPVYKTPEQAVGAFMHLDSHARTQRLLGETPRAIPLSFDLDRPRTHDLLTAILQDDVGALPEAASKAVLGAYGIPVTRPEPADDTEEAVAVAEGIGYPVVLKVRSPDVTHKTDVGGVITNVESPEAVRASFERIRAGLAEREPGAGFAGVTVQPMITSPGHELIVGARRDATFGAVILVGAGGTAAELLGDTVLELPPLNERLARGMLERLRVWPLLQGYRGRPGAQLEKLIELLVRFSYLISDYPEIAEAEMNPVLATETGAIALDARFVIERSAARGASIPFSHLAIRPYPEELTTSAELPDGTPAVIRPIKPEDEPMWRAMLEASSPESIRARFRALFGHTTHQMAVRYCFIDYDREIAMVAEVGEGAERRLAGVGRLVADQDREQAEYALLVADPWQNLGLSAVLTERCLEVAREWGVRRVWAETTPDNDRMIAVLRRHGFELERRVEDDVMVGTLELRG